MEIFLIGTVHYSTSNFSDIDLLNILNTIKPDVIFEEWPVDNPPYNKDISDKEMESKAIQNYCKFNNCTIFPYDIQGRNSLLKENSYFENIKELNEAIEQMKLKNEFTIEDMNELRFLDEWLGGDFEYSLNSEYPRVINSSLFDEIVKLKIQRSNALSDKITSNYKPLHSFKGFIAFDIDFWNKRNEAMVDNITKYISNNQNKKCAVIICGAYHRYILKEIFSSNSSYHLNEYWEHKKIKRGIN